MFKVKNSRTNRFIKDAITCKAMSFDDRDYAEYFAQSLERDSIMDSGAWNSKRPSKFVVVESNCKEGIKP